MSKAKNAQSMSNRNVQVSKGMGAWKVPSGTESSAPLYDEVERVGANAKSPNEKDGFGDNTLVGPRGVDSEFVAPKSTGKGPGTQSVKSARLTLGKGGRIMCRGGKV
jgi:hypothetical protein